MATNVLNKNRFNDFYFLCLLHNSIFRLTKVGKKANINIFN